MAMLKSVKVHIISIENYFYISTYFIKVENMITLDRPKID
jgi:hypothetical protein